MAKTLINFRIDEDLKIDVEEMGISLSTAFTIFAKKLVRERKIPFIIDVAPFYSKKIWLDLTSLLRKWKKQVELFII